MIWRGDGAGRRVAACLLTLFDQVSPRYPGRDTSNDGTLGDERHQATHSEHNPDARGIVRALDITHDPAHGFDSYKFADYLREHWDDRVQYLISNSRIANIDVGAKAWRPYNGSNPHDHHVHISARADDRADDPKAWDIQPFFDGSVAHPQPVPVPFIPLDQRTIDAIATAAAGSDAARYSWGGRGRASAGYIAGVAVVYGQMLRRLAARDSAALAMVRVVNGHADVFDHYQDILISKGMPTADAPEVDRLRALFAVLLGLGMRESSGGVDIGRDRSASNTSADTAEAGTWQQSRDSFAASGDPELPKLFAAYVGSGPDAVDAISKRGISPLAGSMENSGDPDSDGYKFQELVKARPSIAALFAAIGMRTLYTHWGPLKERAAEVISEADALFRQVQEIVGSVPTTQRPIPMPDPITPQPTPQPQPNPKPAPIPQPQPQPQLPAVLSSGIDVGRILQFVVDHEVDAHKVLTIAVQLHNSLHPDRPVNLQGEAGIPASDPARPSVLQKPSVQLGTAGLLITSVLQALGVVGMPVGEMATQTGTLATLLSLGTAALGATGGFGKIASIGLNLLGSLARASINK